MSCQLFSAVLLSIFGFDQRSVRPETQSLESTLYPDVLKIKTIIVVKQNFAKMPFVYYLQIHYLATLMPGDVQATELPDIGL